MCLWNTNAPDNGRTDGQGHKDKYLDTSRKILSQEMLMCNMKALIFNNLSQFNNVGTQGRVLSQGLLNDMWNIKALALIVQKLLARLKFQRGGQNDRQDNINIKSCLLSYSISSEHEVLLSTSSEPSELDMPYAQNWGVQICHVMKVSITTFNTNIFLKMALKGGGMKFSFPYIDKIWEWD